MRRTGRICCPDLLLSYLERKRGRTEETCLGFKEECRQDEEGQLIISGSLGEKQKAFLMAMTDMKSILVTGHDYQHSSLLVPAGTFSQKSASGSLKATVDTSLMLLYAMRSHIVYIEQGNTLMSGTIRDNLLLANPVATDEQLTEALHVACADFVFSLLKQVWIRR